MPRIPGLSKDVADMALQLFREGADLDLALNSAARLSDSTPQQLAFADDLIRRRNKAVEKVNLIGDGYSPILGLYNPNNPTRRSLGRLNKSLDPRPDVDRLTRNEQVFRLSRAAGRDAAENRLREELALAAAAGNPERLQTILIDLGYLPDFAYQIAYRYAKSDPGLEKIARNYLANIDGM